MNNNYLVQVYNNTKEYFQNNPRFIPHSIKYKSAQLNNLPNNINNIDCIIEVSNIDSFELALLYVEQGFNPAVLNMASEYHPGGGVHKGSRAQEEDLFRRSNAYITHSKRLYPILSDEIIYSPEITIIKNNRYEIIEEKKVSMIACPALRNPILNKDRYSTNDYKIMCEKIENIFKVAILNGNDSLVLGALGCGAFHNPPKQVAKIFKLMIDKYKIYFRKIGFAILVIKDSDLKNLEIFQILQQS